MADVTISLRIDKQLHQQMKVHEEINWSAAIRKSISEQIDNLETINLQRAMESKKIMDRLRKARAFDNGKSSTAVIREWREKRR